MNDLEQLLSTPMAEINDHGFSAEILAKIEKFNHQRQWFLGILYSISTLLLLTFFPLRAWLQTLFNFVLSHKTLLTNVTVNNQQIAAQLAHPMVLFAIMMSVIYMISRLEN